MPKVKKYVCPICEEVHDNEDAAEDCLEDCKDSLMVIERLSYVCGKCGETFRSAAGMAEHEKGCTVRMNPIAWNENGCGTCERCTKEGYIDADCRKQYADLPRNHCPTHVAARA